MKFELPSDEHKTAEDKPTFQSAKIKGKAIQRSDGNWRHRLDEEEVGFDPTVARIGSRQYQRHQQRLKIIIEGVADAIPILI